MQQSAITATHPGLPVWIRRMTRLRDHESSNHVRECGSPQTNRRWTMLYPGARGTEPHRWRRIGINFAFVISSQCCACRCTACACSLSQFFCRGRHGQESEEGKEDREGSHQENGKEDFKEKEVTVSATEKSRLRGRNPTQSETSPKDLKYPLQPFGIAARQYKAGLLCSWLLHKGPVFRFRPDEDHDLLLREGSQHGMRIGRARFSHLRCTLP